MRAQVGEIELNYELRGSGPTIVLTHGIGSSGQDMAPLASLLADRFRVLTWDVRGFGQSSRPAGGYAIAQYATDLAGLLDHLGIEQAVVGGHSMGGTITQRFILDYPRRTLAAIIMSTSSEVNAVAAERWRAQADAIEKEGFAAYTRRNRPAEQTEDFLKAHPELLEAEERRIRNNPDGRVYAQAARAVADYNYTAELESVRIPALVLVGDKDTQTPPGGSVIISRRIANAELHILPGITHALPREAAPQVAALITAFLDRVLQPA